VLREAAQFLRTYGFWPALRELGDFIQQTGIGTGEVNFAGLRFACENLVAMQMVDFRRHKRLVRVVMLTSLGWQVLGLKPKEPTIRRPQSLLTRLVHKITIDLADIVAAQAEMDKPPADALPMKKKPQWMGVKRRWRMVAQRPLEPGESDAGYDKPPERRRRKVTIIPDWEKAREPEQTTVENPPWVVDP